MKIAAGILMYRFKPDLQVFLVHPGGPFWKNKDLGSWSIPKGEIKENEELVVAAVREFQEETGIVATIDNVGYLGEIVQRSGKKVYAWSFENDFNGTIVSNFVESPEFAKFGRFPEVDKGEYFSVEEAKKKIMAAQILLIEKLEAKIK